MKVIDLLKVCKGAPYVRIIAGNRDGEVLAGGYATGIDLIDAEITPYRDALVLEFFAQFEIRHKKHEELGLLPPYKPDLAAQYEFSDLRLTLYYDIIVEG